MFRIVSRFYIKHKTIFYSRFGDFVDRIYPIELEIKDTIYTDRYASYLDLHIEIDSEERNFTTIEMFSIFPL